MKYFLITFILLGILSCTSSDTNNVQAKKPDNIIFLIGDGMGLSAVSSGFFYGDEPSQFYRFENIGLQKTNSLTHKVTDSAASGTALASGTKTYNGAIGIDTAGTIHTNIAELVSGLGWSTGVVATSTISHATPASFYAHVVQRSMEDEISYQLIKSGIDFFAGGGLDHFNKRKDSLNLLDSALVYGFHIDTTSLAESSSLESGKKYGFLLKAGAMPPALEGRGNFLSDATMLALSHLSGNKEGFFLMVEASQIDWAGHGNNSSFLIGEQLDFEKVIKAAMDFAEEDGNTLVIVTADHETGGYTLSAKGGYGIDSYAEIEPTFATGGHSATLIPVFAYGPGAENFRGVYENTEIFEKMKSLVK